MQTEPETPLEPQEADATPVEPATNDDSGGGGHGDPDKPK